MANAKKPALGDLSPDSCGYSDALHTPLELQIPYSRLVVRHPLKPPYSHFFGATLSGAEFDRIGEVVDKDIGNTEILQARPGSLSECILRRLGPRVCRCLKKVNPRLLEH